MKTIYRYILTNPAGTDIEMPEGAEILPTVNPCSKGLAIFALIDTKAKPEIRRFYFVKTGQKLVDSSSHRYVTSFCFPGNPAIHLFEAPRTLKPHAVS